MGDIADAILEGYLCERCGVFITDEPPGHPQTCDYCDSTEVYEDEMEIDDNE